jgi:Tol biopolymer transport system component
MRSLRGNHSSIVKTNVEARKGSPTPLQARSATTYLPRMSEFRRFVAFLALPPLLAACGTNEPAPDPGPGRITFTRLANGIVDIYAMDVNGHNLQLLTTSFAYDTWGSWSPDTFKMVFQSDRIPDTTYAARFQIYVMNSDGTNIGQLTFPDPARDSTGLVKDTTRNSQPAWSPDGTKIAFASTRDTNSEIFVMDPNGSNIVRLTSNPAADGQPVWSPDGTKIAFATDRDGNDEIYVMNADGSGQVNLTNHAGSDLVPAWSPDGTKIAFQSDRQTSGAVWVMDADGSNPVRLTNPSPSTAAGNPSWSPDGTRIVYEQNGDIWVMNVDGSRKIQITSGFWSDRLPRWRPIL